MSWDNLGCSECGYEGANGETLTEGDGCPCCGGGTMLASDDFEDKFGEPPEAFG